MQRGTVIEYRGKRGKVFRVQYRDASGRQVKETLGSERDGWTKKTAQEALADRLHAVRNDGFQKPKPTKFAGFADRWLEEAQLTRGWSANTVMAYRGEVERLKREFGEKTLAEIRPSHASAFLTALLREGEDWKTVSRRRTVLGQILDKARTEKLIRDNPVRETERPKGKRRKPRPLTPEETRAMYQAFDDEQMRLAFLTFALTGMRWCELSQLRWRDVTLSERRLRVVESKSEEGERSIAIPSPLDSELERRFQRTNYKADSDYVFCHPHKGSRLRRDSYYAAFRAAQRRAGIEGRIRPAHDLRVTSITNGLIAGENPGVLMARAGHRNYRTTQDYINLAGVVFPEHAEALSERLFGARAYKEVRIGSTTGGDKGAPSC